MRVAVERGQGGNLIGRRQARLFCDVAVPQSAVVGADVAQVVQAAQSGGEHPAVADAVALCNVILVRFLHAAEQFGHAAPKSNTR